jgi:hypothetical protein
LTHDRWAIEFIDPLLARLNISSSTPLLCRSLTWVRFFRHFDQVIPRVPVRQWVLSFPIPLRILFAAHPELLTPVLRIIHRVIASFLLKQAGLKRATGDTGAVTLIQRFGSAANLNIHVHCLVLDGVYRRTEGEPVFQQARAPTRSALQGPPAGVRRTEAVSAPEPLLEWQSTAIRAGKTVRRKIFEASLLPFGISDLPETKFGHYYDHFCDPRRAHALSNVRHAESPDQTKWSSIRWPCSTRKC